MSLREAAADPDAHPVTAHLLHDHVWALRVAIGLWVIAGLLFLAMAIPPVRDGVVAFDREVYEATFPLKWAPLTAGARALSFLGSAAFMWPLRLAVAAYLALKRRWAGFWVWVLAVAVSEPLIGVLKAAYDRARPSVGLITVTTGSFPSGHAIAGSVVALSLVIVLVPAGPARRNLEMLAGAFALLMAGSRVYLGAHWLSDVAAGLAVGTACAVGVAALVQRVVHRDVAVAAPDQGGAGTGPSDS